MADHLGRQKTVREVRRASLLQSLLTLVMVTVMMLMPDAVAVTQNLKLVIHGQHGRSPLNHFWQSTGFCPPLPHQSAWRFDLGSDMTQNLAYIGALPHAAIKQVRIHWLLDLIRVHGMSAGWPVYDFTLLDRMMDLLHVNRLRPGFELMGNPGTIFSSFTNKTQVYWWRHLVAQLASRYIDRYGVDHVKTWNFETWNEPDCHDFDKLSMTVQGFLNYYDACSEGLKAASPLLKLGGPADGCDQTKQRKTGGGSEYREALFQHVVNGTNFFTGERGVRLDFISLHRKGEGTARRILDDELKSMADISKRYPSLTHTPFYNDEADPLVGWSKPEEWRATASYAALAVKVIAQHQNLLIASGESTINYTLLSNDNAFLSYHPHPFTQRTLLARFQMNRSAAVDAHHSRHGDNSSVHFMGKGSGKGREDYVTFVRKPIYTAMALLAKLGSQQVFSQLVDQQTGKPIANDSYAGCVATLHTPSPSPSTNSPDSLQWSAVVYSSSDTSPPSHSGQLDVEWWTSSVNATDLMLAVYGVSDTESNPYLWWRDACRQPDFPSLFQFQLIRRHEGPYRYNLTAVKSDERGVVVGVPSLQLREPHVLLLHLCQASPSPPLQVTDVRLINITAGQVLVVWSDVNVQIKCIKTFEVEQYREDWGMFRRINTDGTIINLFVHATDAESMVRGRYRVRAVDYWERPGPYSPGVLYLDV